MPRSFLMASASLRSMAVVPRAAGRPFMPTLTTYYYPAQHGEHPTAKDKDGKPLKVTMSQSGDEMEIKSYLAIGALFLVLGAFSAAGAIK